MSIEVWQEIPAIEKFEQKPILSTLSDRSLVHSVTEKLELSNKDSLRSDLRADAHDFLDGRVVVVRSLSPRAVQSRIAFELGVEEDRWFTASEFILRLTDHQAQGCYGGWSDAFALTVFGHEL